MRARLAISRPAAFFAAFFVILLALPPARADDAADAKTHYQKATAHYAVGEYKEAAGEYEAAYKAKQDPALLYNAAQSHRLAGDNQKALLLYKNIVKLHPTSKYAVESKDRIDKLEQAIATTQSPPNQPAPVESGAPPAAAGATVQPLAPAPTGAAATPPPGAPPPAVAPAPAPGTSPAATLTAAPAPTEGEAPVYKKVWFWAVIGAVVVGGVVVAVAASGGSSGTWSNVGNVQGAVR
jgi:tetratricopeptide (TPR) repeat protein